MNYPFPFLFSFLSLYLIKSSVDDLTTERKFGRLIGDPLECAILDDLTGPWTNPSKDQIKQNTGIWKFNINTKTAVWSPLMESGPNNLNSTEGNQEKNNEGGEILTKTYVGTELKVQSKVCHSFNAELQRMTVISKIDKFSSLNSRATKKSEFLNEQEQRNAIKYESFKDTVNKKDNYGSKELVIKANVKDNYVDESYLIACKGSPESVFSCLCEKQRLDPQFESWYYNEYKRLAREGKRVISFASKEIKYNHHNYSISTNDINYSPLEDMIEDSMSTNISSSCHVDVDHKIDLAVSNEMKDIEGIREKYNKNEKLHEMLHDIKNETENENDKRRGRNRDYEIGEGVWVNQLLDSSREEVERNLEFQGFVSFACPLRYVFVGI